MRVQSEGTPGTTGRTRPPESRHRFTHTSRPRHDLLLRPPTEPSHVPGPPPCHDDSTGPPPRDTKKDRRHAPSARRVVHGHGSPGLSQRGIRRTQPAGRSTAPRDRRQDHTSKGSLDPPTRRRTRPGGRPPEPGRCRPPGPSGPPPPYPDRSPSLRQTKSYSDRGDRVDGDGHGCRERPAGTPGAKAGRSPVNRDGGKSHHWCPPPGRRDRHGQ